MQISVRWAALFCVGAMAGTPVAGKAQSIPPTWSSLVGTWTAVHPENDSRPIGVILPNGKAKLIPADTSDHSRGSTVSLTLTFRPDSIWFKTRTKMFEGDTFSCTMKYRGYVSGDTLVRRAWAGKSDEKEKVVLTSPSELALVNRRQMTYRRLTVSPSPPQDYVLPISTRPASGTLARLEGTWEYGTGGRQRESDSSLVHETLTIRPNRTSIHTRTWRDGADTFSCTTEWRWKWESVAGDTLTVADNNRSLQWKMVVRGQQLVRWAESTKRLDPTRPVRVYRHVATPSQP